MVQSLKCKCDSRYESEINSISLLEEIKSFFNEQIEQGFFAEEKASLPYCIWNDKNEHIEYYASKWYRCNICGCLWEIKYPDFPAKGFVKKYKDGKYMGTLIINNDEKPKKADVIVRSKKNNNVYYMFSDELFIHGYCNKSISIPFESGVICFNDMYYAEADLCITVATNKDHDIVYVLDEENMVIQKTKKRADLEKVNLIN